jgi:methionine aminopeptidase
MLFSGPSLFETMAIMVNSLFERKTVTTPIYNFLTDRSMPFVKTWTEELISEWLLLKGYIALQNVRLKSGRGGGIREADILGLKLRKETSPEADIIVETLEILHIEIGSLPGRFEKNSALIKDKFVLEREEAIKDILIDIIELESVLSKCILGYSRLGSSKIEYKPIYIANYVAKKQVNMLKERLKREGIEFLTLEEVLREIIHEIGVWKKRLVEKGFRITEQITLPESWWLLNLIDYLKKVGFINIQ